MCAAVSVHLPLVLGYAEKGERTRGVMRTYNVHQVVEHVPRVVFTDALHALREMLGSAAVQKAEDGVSQRVVHDGIQFAALEIAPTLEYAILLDASSTPHR